MGTLRFIVLGGAFAFALGIGIAAVTKPAEAHPRGYYHCHSRPVCGRFRLTQRRCGYYGCRVVSRRIIRTCARCHR